MIDISFDDLIKKPSNDNFIYRGEPEQYKNVSSGLLREHLKLEYLKAEHDNSLDVGQSLSMLDMGISQATWDVEQHQRFVLEYAEKFLPGLDEREQLTRIQHLGGKTNLIDFTTNYYVALFFACEKRYDKNGRVILLDRSKEMGEFIYEPAAGVDRAEKQASIFVHPPKGYFEPKCYEALIVPGLLKRRLLNYLQCEHNISELSIYKDHQGLIRHLENWREAQIRYRQGNFYRQDGKHSDAIKCYDMATNSYANLPYAYNNRGLAYHSLGEYERAIEDFNITEQVMPDAVLYFYRGCTYNAMGNYEKAVVDFSKSLGLYIGPKLRPWTYGERGLAFLHLKEWAKARLDFNCARHLGLSVKSFFSNHYIDVADFEEKNDVKVPKDIVETFLA